MSYYRNVTLLQRNLSCPVHDRNIRCRTVMAGRGEADLSAGYRLEAPVSDVTAGLTASLADFNRFMNTAMMVRQARAGYAMELKVGPVTGAPAGTWEAHRIEVHPDRCIITAKDPNGFRRALVWLEDEMSLRKAPYLRRGSLARWTSIEDRITRSPLVTGRRFELLDKTNYYPDEYLNALMHCGINGIWVAGLYRRLIASNVLPVLGPRKHRLAKLRELVARAGRYGIRVYFFCIEPRAVPDDHPVFAAHPEIKGAKLCDITSSLCVSHPLVKSYVREATKSLFQEAPGLAGIINIFNGERGTTCWLDAQRAAGCPRCRKRKQWDVLAEDLNLFYEGMHAASPDAKLLAWTYSMDDRQDSMTAKPVKPVLEIMKRTHPKIVWLGNFEHGGRKRLGRKPFHVNEYSLSYTGPSASFRKIAGMAAERGCRVYAKLQVGTTYELPSVPYLPVPNIVYDKVAAMNKINATGTLASWFGGYPSIMLKVLGEAAFQPRQKQNVFLKRLAAISWGKEDSEHVVKAWTCFSRAFQYYPCNNEVFYHGPIARSPSYHLYLKRQGKIAWPYNFLGYDAQHRVRPYEDELNRWVGEFTVDEIINAFRHMGKHWSKGVRILESIARKSKNPAELNRQVAVAKAAQLQFLSAANVYEFYQLRDQLKDRNTRERQAIMGRMRRVALDDVMLAQAMKRCLTVNPFIGLYGAKDYIYSAELLDAKIRQVKEMLKTLACWQRSGVDEAVVSMPALTKEYVKTLVMKHINREYYKDGVSLRRTYREWDKRQA